jgi:hypothetical protein
MGFLIPILTSVLGTVAKGAASKAIGGALAGAVINSSGPLLDVFSTGVVAGAKPAVGQLGAALGQAIIGGAIGYVTVWLAPANKAKA